MLTLEGLGHRYGDHWVFRNVELDITLPTSVAILGPSGVGKTTLLAITGGLLRPREGSVALGGAPCSEPRAGSVAWVFQTSNAFGNRSVTDNVLCPLLLTGMDDSLASRRATAAMKSVGLFDRRRNSARHLSGGELQRVGIARAIALATDFIFADEPTGQLDETTTAEVVEALIVDRTPNSLVLVVTHDPYVAEHCEQEYRLSATGLDRIR